MSAKSDTLVIEELARSEAELRAMVNELLADIAMRDEMISVLLESANADILCEKWQSFLARDRGVR